MCCSFSFEDAQHMFFISTSNREVCFILLTLLVGHVGNLSKNLHAGSRMLFVVVFHGVVVALHLGAWTYKHKNIAYVYTIYVIA